MKLIPLYTAIFLSIASMQVMADHKHGDGVKNSDNTKNSDVPKTKSAKPPIAVGATFDDKGALWLANVKNQHLYVSYSNDLGKTFSAPVKVNSEPENIQADGENRPKIFAKDGNVYVSYTKALEKPWSGDVRFSRSNDHGKTFAAPVTVNDNREVISHRFDAMTVDNQGKIYVAWLDKRDASLAQQIGEKYIGAALYYAVSSDGGASFAKNLRVAENSCECCRLSMTMDTDGVPVLAWRQVFNNKFRDHALLKLDGKSSMQRMSFENWKIDACPHQGPSLAIAEDGTYHAVWFSLAENSKGLFYSQSSDKGSTFAKPMAFGDLERQPARPAILALQQRVAIVWKQQEGDMSVIYSMLSADAGKTWSPATALARTSDLSDNPNLLNYNNTFYLSWNTLRENYRLIEIAEVKP